MAQVAMMVDVGVGHVLEGQMLEPVKCGLDASLSGPDALKKFGEV
jgi:hypothetical protein